MLFSLAIPYSNRTGACSGRSASWTSRQTPGVDDCRYLLSELKEVIEHHLVNLKNREALARAEENLENNTRQFRVLFEGAADALYLIDSRTNIIDVNRQATLDLGYTREELLQMNVSDVDQGFKTRSKEKWFWEEKPEGHAVTFEAEHTRKDGSVFPVEIKLSLIRNVENEHPFLLAAARNISERKQVQEALWESERHLRILMDQAPLGILAFDNHGRVVDVNPKSLQILGSASREDTIGFECSDFTAHGRFRPR